MSYAKAFIGACRHGGIDAFFGVPCSYLADAFTVLEAPDSTHYWPAAREDLALGAAAGASLAGKMPAVLMQNSGLGVGLNALQSLLQLYNMPCLLIISWRGEPQAGFSDAPEHHAAGAQMQELLRLCNVPTFYLESDNPASLVRQAVVHSRKLQTPVALIVRRGLLDQGSAGTAAAAPMPAFPRTNDMPSVGAEAHAPAAHSGQDATKPSVDVCMSSIMRRHPEALVVACNGFISREVFAACDRPQNFYMLGSMGLATSIGLGAALAAPKRPVVVLEGDGNALMALGALAMVGQARPRNLWHIVLDNGMHRSTGAQRTAGNTVDFAAVARACGYTHAAHATRLEVPDALTRLLTQPAPAYLVIRNPTERGPASRVRLSPVDIAQRVRAVLKPS